jgi:hypothetical protein
MLENEDDWWRKDQIEEKPGAKPFVSVSHGVVNLRVGLLLDFKPRLGLLLMLRVVSSLFSMHYLYRRPCAERLIGTLRIIPPCGRRSKAVRSPKPRGHPRKILCRNPLCPDFVILFVTNIRDIRRDTEHDRAIFCKCCGECRRWSAHQAATNATTCSLPRRFIRSGGFAVPSELDDI